MSGQAAPKRLHHPGRGDGIQCGGKTADVQVLDVGIGVFKSIVLQVPFDILQDCAYAIAVENEARLQQRA